MTLAYFNKVRPTYIENWSAILTNASVKHSDIPLTLPEARALGVSGKTFSDWFIDNTSDDDFAELINSITEKIEKAFGKYPDGAFVRLGSRSAKDSTYAHVHGLRIKDAAAAVKILTSDSHRIAFDLRLALKHNYPPHIFVRQWSNIPAWSEFRCFVRDQKLVGISQYDCKNFKTYSEITEHTGLIKAGIESFHRKICSGLHLENVVFDVFAEVAVQSDNSPIKITLLELNPFVPQTDACLFNWNNGADFDGSFRFL